VKAVLLGTVDPPVTPGNSSTATPHASVFLLTYISLFPAAPCKTAVTFYADAYVKAVLLGTVEPPVIPGNSGTATAQASVILLKYILLFPGMRLHPVKML
jgi:hypothetical protein